MTISKSFLLNTSNCLDISLLPGLNAIHASATADRFKSGAERQHRAQVGRLEMPFRNGARAL